MWLRNKSSFSKILLRVFFKIFFLVLLIFVIFNLTHFSSWILSLIFQDKLLLFFNYDVYDTYATTDEINYYNALVREVNGDSHQIFNFLIPFANFDIFSSDILVWHSWISKAEVEELELDINEPIRKFDYDPMLDRLESHWRINKQYILFLRQGVPSIFLVLMLIILL